jgi:hypothetical protein
MIIDIILDRKNGKEYNADEFFEQLAQYSKAINDLSICNAFGMGTEKEVKDSLCNYVTGYGYNTEICKFINKVKWL